MIWLVGNDEIYKNNSLNTSKLKEKNNILNYINISKIQLFSLIKSI